MNIKEAAEQVIIAYAMGRDMASVVMRLQEAVSPGSTGTAVVVDHATMDAGEIARLEAGWEQSQACGVRTNAPQTNDKLDASRWRALMNSERIRILGTAGFEKDSANFSTGYRHFGMEVWSQHCAKENAYGRIVLREYADAEIERNRWPRNAP